MNHTTILMVSQLENFVKLLATLVVFIIILVITYSTTRWIGSYQKTKFTGKNIEYIEGMRLTNNKYIQILRLGKEYVAVAVCKDTITFITKIDENDLVFDDNSQMSAKDSFSAVFAKLKDIKTGNQDGNSEDNKKDN